MTYGFFETSRQSGMPAFLYQFNQGEQEWRLAALPRDYTYGGKVYRSSSVSHTEPKQSDEISKAGISLSFSREDEFAIQFLGYAPDLVTTVTMYRLHLNDGDLQSIVFWKGRVSSSKTTGNKITLECESIFTSMRRPGLRARYQRSCRHALYSAGCGVTMESRAIPCAPTEISANATVVTIPEAAGYDDGWFFGGMLGASDASLRLITGHAGSSITLSRPLLQLVKDIVSGDPVSATLYPGCNHTMADCRDKFSNIINYGGFPWIPTTNPFGGTSVL